MNCKPGDLAVIVRAKKDMRWLGRVVTVVRAFPLDSDAPSWITEPLPTNFVSVYDHSLRPIRDQDGEDEMLRIAGLPKEREAV